MPNAIVPDTITLTFDVIVCYITSPSTLVHADYSTNIVINGSATSSTVKINPFAINDSTQCGALAYTVVSSHASDSAFDDVFTSGKASFDSVDTFRFDDIQNYPTGDLSVTVKVSQ